MHQICYRLSENRHVKTGKGGDAAKSIEYRGVSGYDTMNEEDVLRMRKWMVLVLCLALVVALAGCGGISAHLVWDKFAFSLG